MNQTKKISKIINYTKHYDTSMWSIDCLYCKLHNVNKELDTWYDCDECCSEIHGTPTETLLKQRFKMKLIRNVLVVPTENEVIDPEEEEEKEEKEENQTWFFIKGISQLNKFMKDDKKYLERNAGIKFEKDFCKSVQKKFYQETDIGMEELVFKIDFAKASATTKTGALFLYVLISGKYSLPELIGKSITNDLGDLED
tara:strand:- start:5639 stop:6232 length:594 start_codon:yes stop_codon:yes gene_type:complete